MSELRIPDIPLPRPFLRVLSDEVVTRDDVEKVKRSMQQTIDLLQTDLKRERELVKTLEKSGEVLNEILSSPDFRALSHKAPAAITAGGATATGATSAQIDEGPVEYIDVVEIELTDAIVSDADIPAQVKKD
ncbi:hypothetical protein [Turneriella parva]|nr:hypothetical protein [Turneriella parva]